MAAQIYYSPFIPAFSSSGAPVPGAQLYFYYTSTLTKAPIWTTSSLSVPLTNPVVAAANGKYPDIYLDGTITYRVRQLDGNGNQIGDDIDPYVPGTAIMPTPPTVNVGTTTTLGTGVPATVTNAGTAQNAVFNFGIPTGPGGPAATVAVGTVSALPAGSTPVVTNVGTSSAAILNFSLAQGNDGVVGVRLTGNGIPANNYGNNGDTYVDLSTGIIYGPKSGGKWPLGTNADVNSATPSRTKIDLRLSGATLPTTQATVTRASSSTDMIASDPYTYSPTTYGNNVPLVRLGKGLGVYGRAQQLLAAPAAPVNETVTVPAGVIVVTAWGPGGSQTISAAGTAVGTGFGTLSGTAGIPQFITITTPGTITLTPSGGLVKSNVQYNPSLPASTQPVPYIATQSIREADLVPAGSALLAALASTQGYLLMGVSDQVVSTYGAPPCILGLNATAAWFPTSATALTLYDVGSHSTNTSIGSGSFVTGTTIGQTWDGTATVTFGGGDKLEVSHAFQHNNGVAVTAAALGGPKGSSNTGGLQNLNGFIGWYEYGTDARLSDEALYSAYTSFRLPVLSDMLKNYTGAGQFRKFLTAYRQCQAGIIDHVRVADFGSSHHAGTNSVLTNVRASGPTAQMIADLKAEGVFPVNDDFFGGMQGLSWTGGTNQYDNRLTYAGGTPTGFGNQNGVQVIRIPAGATLTFTPALNSSQFRLMYYTGIGYGSIEVSKDGGTTPIIPGGGGSATISTNSAASYQVRDFSATLAANSWTIKAVGSAVDISFGYSFDPSAKQIVFGNFACYGYTAAGLSLDASPESSVLGPLKQYAPHLCFGCSDNTNSMSPLLTYSTYSTGVAAILAAEQLTADVILYTDPPSDLSFVSQATQDTIFNYGRSLGWQNGLPMFDYAGWAITYLRLPNGFYGGDPKHLEKRGVKRTKSNPQKALFKQIMALA
jgi:hypothetical protein